MKNYFGLLAITAFILMTVVSCKKDKPVVPTLTTSSISEITGTTAKGGGSITADGGAAITQSGVCWSTSSSPTITDKITSENVGTGNFASSITGLTEETKYYVRAYATNSAGTAYGPAVSFTTIKNPILDYDGNVYTSVTIGTQVWMVENLRTTHYRNGDPIPIEIDGPTWAAETTGACCYQENLVSNGGIYGVLYNWFAVNDSRNLCPVGWHVPNTTEWNTLQDYLGGDLVAGGKMKETGFVHWQSPNTGATNSSHFTGLPGACRSGQNFSIVGQYGIWWTSSPESTTKAYCRQLNYDAANLTLQYSPNPCGLSVRCIKN